MDSYAQVGQVPPEEWLPHIRELLAYDAKCEISATFVREQFGNFIYRYLPSPLHWSRQVEWPWVLEEGKFAWGQRVLDIGGGWSVLKYPVAKRCGCVYSLEIDEPSIVKAQKTIDALAFDTMIHQVKGDAHAIPFPANWFDRVLCVSVLEHIPEGHDRALAEMLRVLKPGGVLLLTMDVVIQGTPGTGNNFYVTREKLTELLATLGIYKLENDPVVGAKCNDEGIGIVCVMAKYTKPGA